VARALKQERSLCLNHGTRIRCLCELCAKEVLHAQRKVRRSDEISLKLVT
jgi:hypothetical protein